LLFTFVNFLHHVIHAMCACVQGGGGGKQVTNALILHFLLCRISFELSRLYFFLVCKCLPCSENTYS